MKIILVLIFNSLFLFGFSQSWTNKKFKRTSSKLQYFIVEKSNSKVDTNANYIYFRYIWYTAKDKQVKLSTMTDSPQKFYIKSNKFVPGFNEALKMLNVGEKAFFIIPKSLAYGDKGIEGEKDLYYYIEIIDRK